MKLYGAYDSPTMPDRLISAASYLTMGLVGFVWLIIVTLQRSYLRPFLKYHIMQSIFISVLAYVIRLLSDIILSMVSVIPVVGDMVTLSMSYLTFDFIYGFSAIKFLMVMLIAYFTITSLMGKYSYFPWISDNIKQML